MIIQRARHCGRPPARYVRETSLGALPKARPSQANDDVIHELGRIGTTLTRLAAEGPPDSRNHSRTLIEATLAELLATVRRLG